MTTYFLPKFVQRSKDKEGAIRSAVISYSSIAAEMNVRPSPLYASTKIYDSTLNSAVG